MVLHELGHAIGFFHEHSRPDRDDHIKVIHENVQPDLTYNFHKRPSSQVNDYGTPYDMNSIMHYGQRAYGIQNKITIKSINPAYQGTIGKREHLSFHDVMLANRIYRCDAGCDPRVVCPVQGFRGRDCKCYCKSYRTFHPVKECAVREDQDWFIFWPYLPRPLGPQFLGGLQIW